MKLGGSLLRFIEGAMGGDAIGGVLKLVVTGC